MRTVVLLSTHFVNHYIEEQIEKLKNEIKDIADFVVLYQEDYNRNKFSDDSCVYPFSIESLNKLGFNPYGETIVPGSNHFPLFQFYRDNPTYDYYWNIEYDVRFSGDWNIFFSFFMDRDIDFLSSHVQPIRQNPYWERWNEMELDDIFIPFDKFLKSFNPIYRLSNRALNFLNDFLKKNHRGHHELLLPTILNYFGFSIADLGGDGDYIIDSYQNLFYTNFSPLDLCRKDSTMRYRPLYNLDDMNIDNMLYHPIKIGK